jgi:cytochrome b
MTDFNHCPVSRSHTRDHVSPVDHSLLCAAGGREVTAWDLPTRLFKWSLVALIIIAWITSGFSDPNMAVHKAAGYGILTLIVYRFLWGFFGGNTARFSNFVRSPAAVIAYFRALRRDRARPYLGHNPAGGLMVLGLLLACGVQALLGLFASDGVFASGPFADLVAEDVSRWATLLHKAWFYVVLGLAAMHICVNLYYQFVKDENLIGAMITGRKRRAAYADTSSAREGSLLGAAGCLIAAIAIVYFGVVLSGGTFFSDM